MVLLIGLSMSQALEGVNSMCDPCNGKHRRSNVLTLLVFSQLPHPKFGDYSDRSTRGSSEIAISVWINQSLCWPLGLPNMRRSSKDVKMWTNIYWDEMQPLNLPCSNYSARGEAKKANIEKKRKNNETRDNAGYQTILDKKQESKTWKENPQPQHLQDLNTIKFTLSPSSLSSLLFSEICSRRSISHRIRHRQAHLQTRRRRAGSFCSTHDSRACPGSTASGDHTTYRCCRRADTHSRSTCHWARPAGMPLSCSPGFVCSRQGRMGCCNRRSAPGRSTGSRMEGPAPWSNRWSRACRSRAASRSRLCGRKAASGGGEDSSKCTFSRSSGRFFSLLPLRLPFSHHTVSLCAWILLSLGIYSFKVASSCYLFWSYQLKFLHP